MLSYLAAYGATALVMLALDLLWRGVIAKSFYRAGIRHLIAEPPNLASGGMFYLLYPVGVLLFAVAPYAWYWALPAQGLSRRPAPRANACLSLEVMLDGRELTTIAPRRRR